MMRTHIGALHQAIAAHIASAVASTLKVPGPGHGARVPAPGQRIVLRRHRTDWAPRWRAVAPASNRRGKVADFGPDAVHTRVSSGEQWT